MDSVTTKKYFFDRDRQSNEQAGNVLWLVDPGENIKVGELEVHVMSAIYRHDYPTPGAFNLMLVGWADLDIKSHNFVCCLGKTRRPTDMLRVNVTPLFYDNRYKIPMRFALFGCTVHLNSSSGVLHTANDFRYVAFAETTCSINTSFAREIAFPEDGRGKFGLCIKIAYGDLDPHWLVEWFEFAKLVGVDVVQVFYHIVSERSMDVFRYYQSTGFVILAPITPAARKGYPPRGFLQPRWEEQAWMDGAIICNDCVHRLSRYDFVAIMDFDELLFPSPPYNTLLEVAQAAAERYPEAASFYIETFIAVLDWQPSNKRSALFFLRYLQHTASDKLDNFGHGKSSPKLVFRPPRVIASGTHDLTPAANFTKKNLPKSSHKFIHYRWCKPTLWEGCDMAKVTDTDILRFESRWVRAVHQLPLQQLGCNHSYIRKIQQQAAKLNDSNH